MNLEEKILKSAELIIQMINSEEDNIPIPEDVAEEGNKLIEEIIEEIVENPGLLLYYDDPNDIQVAKTVVNFWWRILDPEEIFNEFIGGKYTHILVNIMGEYSDRIKNLKPTFISINPEDTEFYIYYQEAMNCWLFGLNNSALIICCSLIESLLKEKLFQINPEYVSGSIDETGVNRYNLNDFIDFAFFNKILNIKEKEIAHHIRELRNKSIHQLKTISEIQTYNAIQNTKNLVESILRKYI